MLLVFLHNFIVDVFLDGGTRLKPFFIMPGESVSCSRENTPHHPLLQSIRLRGRRGIGVFLPLRQDGFRVDCNQHYVGGAAANLPALNSRVRCGYLFITLYFMPQMVNLVDSYF